MVQHTSSVHWASFAEQPVKQAHTKQPWPHRLSCFLHAQRESPFRTAVVTAFPSWRLRGHPVHYYMQSYIVRCMLEGKWIAHVTISFFIAQPHGKPDAIFRGLNSISGGWMPSCKELFTAEDILYVTMQHTVTFKVALAYLMVSLCSWWHHCINCHRAQAKGGSEKYTC